MAHYVLNEELKQLVQQACRQFMTSFQPRPKRPRRKPQGTGGGGGGSVNVSFGYVVDSISAAEGWDSESWGSGDVQVIDYTGAGVGDAVTVYNRYFTSFSQHQPVWLYSDGTYTFVLNVGCGAGPTP